MKQPNTQDSVTRDNRKNWPKFVAVLIVALFAGRALGTVVTWIMENPSRDEVIRHLGIALGACSPWVVLCALLFWAGSVVCYRRAKAAFASWNGEDEDVLESTEHLLSWSILWATASQFFAFAAFSVVVSLIPLGYADYLSLLAAIVGLLAVTFLVLLSQQRVVDLTRRINPEKQGSVYDLKFQKKWLASCDEAERQRIGQAAYSSFLVTSRTAMVVWIAMVLVNLYLPIGPLPVLAALIPWGVGQISYLAACLKRERSGSSSAKG